MNWNALALPDQLGMVIGFIATLCVFSYILKENALFRLATSIFIGSSAAYVLAVIWYQVIWPQLLLPLWSGDLQAALLGIIPIVLSVLLLTKISPRLSSLGNPSLALLVGVGAALAVGGVITGTLVPQIFASVELFNAQAAAPTAGSTWIPMINRGLLLIGTLSSLAYFHYGARSAPGQPPARSEWIEEVAKIGRVFIAITLGAIFAGVFAAALAALVERIDFILRFFQSFGTG